MYQQFPNLNYLLNPYLFWHWLIEREDEIITTNFFLISCGRPRSTIPERIYYDFSYVVWSLFYSFVIIPSVGQKQIHYQCETELISKLNFLYIIPFYSMGQTKLNYFRNNLSGNLEQWLFRKIFVWRMKLTCLK